MEDSTDEPAEAAASAPATPTADMNDSSLIVTTTPTEESASHHHQEERRRHGGSGRGQREEEEEPIMDASFLDDEINTVNDEFSSWRLTLHNNHLRNNRTAMGGGAFGGSSAATTNNNNNNYIIFQDSQLSDLQHCETIASITGSILDQLDFDDDDDMLMFLSTTTPTTTNNSSSSSAVAAADPTRTTTTTTATLAASSSSLTTLSSCSGGPLPLLFSPPPPPGHHHPSPSSAAALLAMSTFSTDSLDKSLLLDKLTRCMNPNEQKNNYTIAFQDSSNSTNNESPLLQPPPLSYKNLLTQSCPSWRILQLQQNSSSMDKRNNNNNSNRRLAEILTKTKEIQTSSKQPQQPQQQQQPLQKVIVCYPNYVLPDLQFLHKKTTTAAAGATAATEEQTSNKSYVLHPREYRSSTATATATTTGRSSRPSRPMSLNDVDVLKGRRERVADWESLEVLLPLDFKKLISTIDKPLEEREKNDPNEKEQDESSSNSSAGGVKYRSSSLLRNTGDPQRKRYSSIDDDRSVRKQQRRLKRFSLQEIEEITEMTKDIDSALLLFSKLHLQQQQQQQQQQQDSSSFLLQQPPHPPTNTPTTTTTSSQQGQVVDENKAALTGGVTSAISYLLSCSSSSSSSRTPQQQQPLSKSGTISSTSGHGKAVIESLCPALYSLLSDGLLPHIDTIFGRVPNTLWRVVEASIQTGPTSQSLSELVLRINSEEELIPEGPVKVNAFITGLLNLGSLTSWLTFLRTKDRLLRTHYAPGSLLYVCNTVGRSLYDQMLVNTLALSKVNYNLDIFHETKTLLNKFKHHTHTTTSRKLNNNRKGGNGSGGLGGFSAMKRSFSDERPKKKQHHYNSYGSSGGGGLPKSKTQHVLRPAPSVHSLLFGGGGLNNKYLPLNSDLQNNKTTPVVVHDKFKKLQLQWEMMASSRDDNSSAAAGMTSAAAATTPSRIPRPIVNSHSPTSQYAPSPIPPNVRPSSAFQHRLKQ